MVLKTPRLQKRGTFPRTSTFHRPPKPKLTLERREGERRRKKGKGGRKKKAREEGVGERKELLTKKGKEEKGEELDGEEGG